MIAVGGDEILFFAKFLLYKKLLLILPKVSLIQETFCGRVADKMAMCLQIACDLCIIKEKEVCCMAKTASVYARVEPEIKEQAEKVLELLGIPMSNAVSMFLRQVVLQRGLPFEMKLPEGSPVAWDAISQEERDAVLQKGYDDALANRVYSAEDVEEELKRELGL